MMMKIELVRTERKHWGWDGILRINGQKVCDTVEHPTLHLPEGQYRIGSRNHPFRRGDGPMLSVKGEIIVGKRACPGMVIHSAPAYGRLYDRLKKEWRRGHIVTLTIV